MNMLYNITKQLGPLEANFEDVPDIFPVVDILVAFASPLIPRRNHAPFVQGLRPAMALGSTSKNQRSWSGWTKVSPAVANLGKVLGKLRAVLAKAALFVDSYLRHFRSPNLDGPWLGLDLFAVRECGDEIRV